VVQNINQSQQVIGMRMAQNDRFNAPYSLLVQKRCDNAFSNVERTFGKTAAVNHHVCTFRKLHKCGVALSDVDDRYGQVIGDPLAECQISCVGADHDNNENQGIIDEGKAAG